MIHTHTLSLSFMLFSFFFGAGNLILPPLLGKHAGTTLATALLGFATSAVLIPIAGLITVAHAGGIVPLSERVGKRFAHLYPAITLLVIGPALSIPRAGIVPFALAIAPLIHRANTTLLAQLIYTTCFFIVSYWLCMRPHTLSNTLGKVLTPALLVLVLLLFLASFTPTLGPYLPAQGAYATHIPFSQGFLDGYLTTDALASLMFGNMILTYLHRTRYTTAPFPPTPANTLADMRTVAWIAGVMLFFTYGVLAHLGALSARQLPHTVNGAHILASVSRHLFGKAGIALLGLIFTIACLTTCAGLLVCVSEYFHKRAPRVSYLCWIRLFTISSFALANTGLERILAYGTPLLMILYPISLVLIGISHLERLIRIPRAAYRLTVWSAGTLSTCAVGTPLVAHTRIGHVLNTLIHTLPLAQEQLCWLIPSAAVLILSTAHARLREKTCTPRGTLPLTDN